MGATNLFYVLSYDIKDVSSAPTDYYSYLLPLCWCSAIWIGAGLSCIGQWFVAGRRWKVISITAVLIPLIAIPLHWREMDRSHYTYADDFARSILGAVSHHAVILSPDWTFVSPSLYLQFGENYRTDVIVLDGELLRRSWYFRFFEKRAPDLYQQCKPEIEAFLRELAKYEKGLQYDGNLITEKYVAMLNAILEAGLLGGHPPYILLNLQAKEMNADAYRAIEQQLRRPPYVTTGVAPQAIGDGFQWVPETPAFRLYRDHLAHPLAKVGIPSQPLDRNRVYDNVTRGVIDRYADFWRYRGDYFRMVAGDCAQAADAYRRSLQLGEEAEAQSGLAACSK
jgi:hypothetical protein